MGWPTLDRRFAGWQPSPGVMALVSLLLWAMVSALDFYVILDLGLSIFYVLPVALATWWVGRIPGLALVCLSTAAWFWADVSVKDYEYPLLPYWNAGVRLGFFVIIHQLLWALKQSYCQQQHWAEMDGLTELYNHRHFLRLLHTEHLRSQRHGDCLTLVYLDLDHFKQVNDRHGHSRGDEVLMGVAQTLRDHLRRIDIVARLGGDEFALLLPRVDGDGARVLCDRLHTALTTANHRHQWGVGFSIGVVTWYRLPPSTDVMLQTVDHLMYEAKQGGKNQVRYWTVAGEET